ncbi:MMPL family transporter [Arenicella sp. 4NH20-0111]|uniref:MMPL family transporter n=1 Tax=Arenicella sp. 4NH20-0111 TaxID=3127648 RepID=UPI003105E1BC
MSLFKLSELAHFYVAVFTCLLLITIGYSASIQGRFVIDTGLADVAPDIVKSEHARDAIDSLRRNIEKRMLLLVTGTDEDVVFDALDQLSGLLDESRSVRILPNQDEMIERLFAELEPYRFSLLSEQQQETLEQSSIETITNGAARSIHSMSSVRVYPFNQDPFGVHSSSLIDLLQTLQSSADNAAQGDLTHQTLSLQVIGDAMSMKEQSTLSQELDAHIQAVLRDHDVTVDKSGVFFFAAHAAQESKQDISLISGISTAGVVLLLLFVFRSVSALLLPVLSVLIGVGFAFVATHAMYGNVHVLTIVFGASLIGIVIDYSLHFFYHCAADNSSGDSNEHNALFRALLLSLCTSLIGYAALSFSGLEALKKVAFFSCCGLMMAWLCVVCVGPMVVRKGIQSKPAFLEAAVKGMLSVVTPLTQRVSGYAVVIIGVAAVSTGFAFKIFSDDPRVFFTAPAALIESEKKVAEVASDYEPGQYVLLLGDSIDEVQARFGEVQRAIVTHTDIPSTSLSSVLSLVPSSAQQRLAYVSQEKLYGRDGAIHSLAKEIQLDADVVESISQQYHDANGLSLTPSVIQKVLGESLPPMWFTSKSAFVGFVLIKKGLDANRLSFALAGVDGAEYVNTLSKTRTALAEQRQSATSLLLLAYILVSVLLILRFKTFKAAFMVCVPLVSSAMLILCAMVFSFQLNLFHIMALFLVLGFGMDYTIFVREMGQHQAKTLQAILLSALTSLLSFGLLSLSNIPVVASFGTALLVGNSFNLVGAFVYSQQTVLDKNKVIEYGK